MAESSEAPSRPSQLPQQGRSRPPCHHQLSSEQKPQPQCSQLAVTPSSGSCSHGRQWCSRGHGVLALSLSLASALLATPSTSPPCDASPASLLRLPPLPWAPPPMCPSRVSLLSVAMLPQAVVDHAVPLRVCVWAWASVCTAARRRRPSPAGQIGHQPARWPPLFSTAIRDLTPEFDEREGSNCEVCDSSE